MIATTTSAVGHRVLIDGSEGSARAGHSATIHSYGRVSDAAVSDARLAAGPATGSQLALLCRAADRGEPARPRSLNKQNNFSRRVWLDMRQALRPLDEHAVAHGAHVRMGAAGGLV